MKGGEKAVDGLQPIEAIDAEGNDGGERFSARNSIGQRDLSALTLAKIVKSAQKLAVGLFEPADDARHEFAGRIEYLRRGRQDNDARVFGRRPEDGRPGQIKESLVKNSESPALRGFRVDWKYSFLPN